MLDPEQGLLEVRVLDAQTRLCDVGALASLVQSLVHLEATRPTRRSERRARPGDVQQRARARLRPGEAAGGRRLRALTADLSAAYLDT